MHLHSIAEFASDQTWKRHRGFQFQRLVRTPKVSAVGSAEKKGACESTWSRARVRDLSVSVVCLSPMGLVPRSRGSAVALEEKLWRRWVGGVLRCGCAMEGPLVPRDVLVTLEEILSESQQPSMSQPATINCIFQLNIPSTSSTKSKKTSLPAITSSNIRELLRKLTRKDRLCAPHHRFYSSHFSPQSERRTERLTGLKIFHKVASASSTKDVEDPPNSKPQIWEDIGHQFAAGELEDLKRSITEMALSRINGHDELFVGGIWALRRSDSLTERRITHVLSMVGFNPGNLKNFKDEPWSHYGKDFEHLLIDIDDVDDADLLIELPRAVRFIDAGLTSDQPPAKIDTKSGTGSPGLGAESLEQGVKTPDLGSNTQINTHKGGVFVHCAAGKSRSVAVTIAYLLWRHPNLFDPNIVGTVDPDAPSVPPNRTRKETANEAVRAALTHIRHTRPMAEPNDGFIQQLELWWEMGCPADRDVESHPIYQRWAYHREVEENLAVGQAPSRLRFEDEQKGAEKAVEAGDLNLRCKKCRRSLATSTYILEHKPTGANASAQCPHFYIEPLSWMRGELEKGDLGGRLICPGAKCGANVGRYEWRGFKCTCGGWVVPAFTLSRGRVDDVVIRPAPQVAGGEQSSQQRNLGIRMPPGARNGNL